MVIEFILTRMERSLEAANLIVERLDKDALAEGRAITQRFAAETLAAFFDGQTDFWPEED